MRVITKPRGHGKTTELIEVSASKWFYIVCMDKNEASRITNEARKKGLDIPHPITFSEFASGDYYGKGIKGFLIDNADKFLQSLSVVPIEAITLNQNQ